MDDISDKVVVYVDGACCLNGQQGSKGGCGIYWGPYHPFNTSETLVGDKQTNNRAELTAAIIALQQAKTINISQYTVVTDSKYVKDGISKWIKNWKNNSWKTESKKDVANKDLWFVFDNLNSDNVEWVWVEAHKGDRGNLESDNLAKQGINCKETFWQNLTGLNNTEIYVETKLNFS